MLKKSQATNYVLFLIIAVFAFVVFRLVGFSSQIVLILLSICFFFLAFFKTKFALLIIVFSMLLSPEISLGGIAGRSIVIRAEDLLLFVVFFGWFAKTAVNKELGLLRFTPLNLPIAIYLTIYLIATFMGILRGFAKPVESVFYFLKYFEYFLLYFMVVNNIKTKKEVKFFIYSMIAVSFIVSMYAWGLRLSGWERVTAPFEGKHDEPNTLGGYLLITLMMTIGLFLNMPAKKTKIMLAVVLFFAFPALLFTLSRASWAGFIGATLVLMMLSRRGKLTMIIASLFVITLFSTIFPGYVQKRIQYTFVDSFSNRTTRVVFGKRLRMDLSTAARIDTWRDGIKMFKEAPLFGHGAASAGAVVDNQYSRLMIEVGIFGFWAFLWLIVKMFKNAIKTLREFRDDPFVNAITAGFIAALVGLLLHSVSAATFIIVRIMEPFWFLAAIVMILPNIENIREQEVIVPPKKKYVY